MIAYIADGIAYIAYDSRIVNSLLIQKEMSIMICQKLTGEKEDKTLRKKLTTRFTIPLVALTGKLK